MDQLVERLVWLCSIPSPTGDEQNLCDELERRLENISRWQVQRTGNSLLCTHSVAPDRPHIVLAGHLDTVRARHDGPVRVEGDRVYGPGASDMKAGLALMLELAEERWTEKLDVSVTLVWYAGEEGPFENNELRNVLQFPFFQRYRPDFAVCLEPSDNEVQLGCMGTMHARVEFRGRAAHSARPWHGRNAIYLGLPTLQRLAALDFEPVEVENLTYRPVMTATMAHGGERRNSIPDRFELNINVRFEPGVDEAEARRRVEQIVRAEGAIEIVDVAPSAMPHRKHWAVKTLLEAGATGPTAKQAWTDVAQFDAAGIPAVNFGPGQHAQAHQPNEWASVQQLRHGREILQRWLGRLGAEDGLRAQARST